jgi:sulfur-carrier protein adenylyltransferase/sulfurtransferase
MNDLSHNERQRYQKHIKLPQIGEIGQLKLRNASVLIVGAGGLGCPVLLYLAAAGVGHLGIIDADVIDLTNLQRQVLYQNTDLNQPKASVAAQRLAALNPEIRFSVFEENLEIGIANSVIELFDFVIDCTDNFAVRYLINDVCVQQGKPFVYGAIHQFEGQISVFNYQQGPTYRCLFPEKPSDFEIPNCAEVGVLGILPGIIGTMQANEAIKIITGIGQVLSGQLLLMDLLENSHRKIKFKRQANAEVVAKEQYEQKLEAWKNGQENDKTCNLMKTITPEVLQEKLDNGDDIFLLDVREVYEFEICHLADTTLIPMNQIPVHVSQIPTDKMVVVYCHHGMRSASVIQYLENNHNFKNLYNLTGGIDTWAVEIDESMDRY